MSRIAQLGEPLARVLARHPDRAKIIEAINTGDLRIIPEPDGHFSYAVDGRPFLRIDALDPAKVEYLSFRRGPVH